MVGIYFIHKVCYWHIVIHVVGLVAIRYGSQTIDPVTGTLAKVVGARLDTARQAVIPVTVSYWLTVSDQPDSVHVGELRQHLNYWQGTSHKSKHDKTMFVYLPGGCTPEGGVCTKHLLAAAKKAWGWFPLWSGLCCSPKSLQSYRIKPLSGAWWMDDCMNHKRAHFHCPSIFLHCALVLCSICMCAFVLHIPNFSIFSGLAVVREAAERCGPGAAGSGADRGPEKSNWAQPLGSRFASSCAARPHAG